jgi:hypothetical protein
MTDKYPPTVQRPALLKLVEALGVQERHLCRDNCGDWQIKGRFGHIYAVPGIPWGGMEGVEGFQLYFRGAPEFEETLTSQGWTWAKKALSFCRVTQDGDTEGFLFLDRLPSPEEAVLIRDKLGIRKKRELSDDNLAQFINSGGDTRLGSGRRSEKGMSEG